MANKYNILFFLQSESGRNDLRLRCRVRWSSNIVSFNVGYRVEKDKWSKETQRCVKSSTHGKNKIQANTINREIERLESRIVEYFDHCSLSAEPPTPDRLRLAVGKESAGEKGFFEVYDEFMTIVGAQKSWSLAQKQKMQSLRNHLFTFDPAMSFATLSEDKLYDFIAYLQTPEAMHLAYPGVEHGLKNTTISRMLGFLRHFLRWANDREYYKGRLHDRFRPNLKGLNVKTVIHLEWYELMTLYNYDFSGNRYLELARDVFCFASFTALRYSDLRRLTWADVNMSANAINLVAQKTSKRTVVPLNKFSRALLDKYSGMEHKPTDKVFEIQTNSLFNRYIKDAAKLAGIDAPVRIVYYIGAERFDEVVPKYEALSIHAARRTCAVNSLSMGLSTFVVKEIGGWANMKSMAPYMAIVNNAKREALNQFDDWDGRLRTK